MYVIRDFCSMIVLIVNIILLIKNGQNLMNKSLIELLMPIKKPKEIFENNYYYMKLPAWYSDYKNFIEKSIEKYLDTYLSIPMSEPLENFKEVVKYACR
jgi:hypothetical protein